MRFIDVDGKYDLRNIQIYLTPKEAKELVERLHELLADPEENEHFHLFSGDAGWELSCSLITRRKLAKGGYTKQEQAVLKDHKFD